MWKAISAFAAAAVLAGAVTILPGMSGDVSANVSAPSAKADRYDAAAGCDQQGWPYYGRECLRDLSRNTGQAVAARIVSTDRLYAPAAAPLPEWAAYLPATHPGWTIDFTLGR